MGGVLAVALFGFVWGEDLPDGLHLFASGDFFHVLVVEFVAGFFVARGPDDGFGGVGEIAAGEIGLGLTQEMSLRSLKPSCCMAKPTEWMTWLVPLTQMVPLGLRTRWQAASQARLNS